MGGITPRASSSDAFTMYYAWGGLGTLPTGFFRNYGNIPNDSGIDVTASSGIYELTSRADLPTCYQIFSIGSCLLVP